MNNSTILSIGRRKTASARCLLKCPGLGKIIINSRDLESYCFSERIRSIVMYPIEITDKCYSIDIFVKVRGGGVMAQAHAIAHSIARSLQCYDKNLRPILKKSGLLSRDSRIKERKKAGQPGARKRFQFSKR